MPLSLLLSLLHLLWKKSSICQIILPLAPALSAYLYPHMWARFMGVSVREKKHELRYTFRMLRKDQMEELLSQDVKLKFSETEISGQFQAGRQKSEWRSASRFRSDNSGTLRPVFLRVPGRRIPQSDEVQLFRGHGHPRHTANQHLHVLISTWHCRTEGPNFVQKERATAL